MMMLALRPPSMSMRWPLTVISSASPWPTSMNLNHTAVRMFEAAIRQCAAASHRRQKGTTAPTGFAGSVTAKQVTIDLIQRV